MAAKRKDAHSTDSSTSTRIRYSLPRPAWPKADHVHVRFVRYAFISRTRKRSCSRYAHADCRWPVPRVSDLSVHKQVRLNAPFLFSCRMNTLHYCWTRSHASYVFWHAFFSVDTRKVFELRTYDLNAADMPKFMELCKEKMVRTGQSEHVYFLCAAVAEFMRILCYCVSRNSLLCPSYSRTSS